MTRLRTVLAAAATVLLLAGCGISTSPVTVPAEFDRPLAIPPLAKSGMESDGTRLFRLSAQEGTIGVFDETRTSTWGFNGAYLGPTLRATRGEKVAVEITNALPELTTVHWHGMHLPAAMDGGPHQPIAPGSTWRPSWKIDQPAATLWYHPHPHGTSEEHLYKGLAGMFIIDDHNIKAADLPSEYGVDDIPVIVQDKDIGPNGELVMENDGNEIGLLGSTILVNGTIGPYQNVTTELVRLRLLNGSTARTYDFGLGDGRSYLLVATDGGFLAAPHQTDRVRLSPGERAEIVVEMSPGTTTMLRSFPPDLGQVAAPFAFGGNDSFDVLELRAAEKLAPSRQIPARLTDDRRIDASGATVTRHFELQGREINGKRMAMDRIDDVVEVETTEIWEVTNQNPYPHNVHVHDVQFEVLTVDGSAPPPELAGRKDTVYLEPRRNYRLIMRFEDYADETAPYMYHCHLLLHEDEGLMGQFVVVDDVDAVSRSQQQTESSPEDHHAGHRHD
jgi:FtsP/CotA-like multicopper oxidase with cupredoxin domain